MIDEKKMELLKKLYTLAERGDRGERAAARRQLDRLMEKYNVQEADITDEALTIHWYTYSSPLEKKLLCQVFYKIAPTRVCYRRPRGEGSRTMSGIKCTAAEALQIEIEYDFYKSLWARELDLFFRAFVCKHEIFDLSPGHEVSDPLDPDLAIRMAKLIDGMEDATLRKMITD